MTIGIGVLPSFVSEPKHCALEEHAELCTIHRFVFYPDMPRKALYYVSVNQDTGPYRITYYRWLKTLVSLTALVICSLTTQAAARQEVEALLTVIHRDLEEKGPLKLK